MIDKTELKRLAEAAPEGPWFGPEYAPGTSYVFDVDLGTLLHYESIDTEQDACLRYVAAANPASVLAMIAENEHLAMCARQWEEAAMQWGAERDQLKDENERQAVQFKEWQASHHANYCKVAAERDQLRAEVAGLRTGYEAYERVKAEVEALRREREGKVLCDLELFETLRDSANTEADEHRQCMATYRPLRQANLDSVVKKCDDLLAALGQGEQS